MSSFKQLGWYECRTALKDDLERGPPGDRQPEHQIIKKRKTALLLVKKFAYESTGNVQ